MFEPSIVIDLSTLDSSGSIITSTIYLEIGQHAFPEKGWNDNTAIILSWWLDNIANGGEKFLFMEGSFYFKDSKSDVALVAWDKEQASYPINWQNFHKSIAKVAKQVIDHLEVQSCSHQDLNILKSKYSLKKNWLS